VKNQLVGGKYSEEIWTHGNVINKLEEELE